MNKESIKQDSNSDEISVGEIIIAILSQWRIVAYFSVVGLLISSLVVFSIQPISVAHTSLSLPSIADAEVFNSTGLVLLNRSELFGELLESSRSHTNFAAFLNEKKLLERYSEQLGKPIDENLTLELIEGLHFNMKSPPVGINEAPMSPVSAEIKISLPVESELLTVTLNGYLEYISKLLRNKWELELSKIKESRLKKIERQIAEIRNQARLERMRQISFIESQNSIRAEKLKLEMQLLVDLEKRNRETQLAEVMEAREIATAMQIVKPKTLNAFSREQAQELTNVTFTTEQELPLYLMGTDYLDALRKTLQSRKDSSLFIRELADIDKELKQIENDPVLRELKARTSDDPFLEALPPLLASKQKIKSSTSSLDNVLFYTEVQQTATHAVNKAKTKLIILSVIMLFSIVFGIVVALLRVSVLKYRQ